HAEPDELCLFEAWDEPQDARLIAPFDLRLKSDEAEMIGGEVVLTQLDGRERLAAGPGIDQADRLHRPEAQRVAAAVRHDFNRQTAFEEAFLVEIVNGCRFRVDQRV